MHQDALADEKSQCEGRVEALKQRLAWVEQRRAESEKLGRKMLATAADRIAAIQEAADEEMESATVANETLQHNVEELERQQHAMRQDKRLVEEHRVAEQRAADDARVALVHEMEDLQRRHAELAEECDALKVSCCFPLVPRAHVH